MLTVFPPPTGDGGCAQPPAPLPPSEPGGHATQREPNFVSLRFCLAAALRRQRLSLHEEYGKGNNGKKSEKQKGAAGCVP